MNDAFARPSSDHGSSPSRSGSWWARLPVLGRLSAKAKAKDKSDSVPASEALPQDQGDMGDRPKRKRALYHSLIFQIAALNMVGLIIFVVGLMVLSQFRRTSVEERTLALEAHSQFITGALEQAALTPRVGREEGQPFDEIDRTEAVEVLRRLVAPTDYRARIYDYNGILIYDSWLLDEEGQVNARTLPDPDADSRFFVIFEDIMRWLFGPELTPYSDDPKLPFSEVRSALKATDDRQAFHAVRQDESGNLILSVAMPVKKVWAHVGALHLATQGDDFDAVLRQERSAILQIFAVALFANVLLALFYARTIVRPIKRLVSAADRIREARTGGKGGARTEIPGYHDRRDEIGDLAGSLNDMMRALNNRIDAIEQFAADVSHEIKTPLTSLRSAVETFDIAVSDKARDKLIGIIKHDVDRLDRLITDISNASRLDAELSREEADVVHIPKMLRQIVAFRNESGHNGGVHLNLEIMSGSRDDTAITVVGIESRLSQVIQNLLENAVSFSPEGGDVTIKAGLEKRGAAFFVVIRIEDQGPGIPEEALTKIFERFYTQRPDEADFGKNSGLGLSISKQIVDAHRGHIWAENLRTPNGEIAGARFTVRLPAQ